MEKRLKKAILIMVLIIVLIIIMLVIMLRNPENKAYLSNKEESIVEESLEEEEIDSSEGTLKALDLVEDKKEYLRVKNSLDKYIKKINQNSINYYGYDTFGNYTLVTDESKINANIYNLLSENYINKKGITIESVRNYVYTIQEECFYIPLQILEKNETTNVKTYAIYGLIGNMSYEPITESYLILNIDNYNDTFSVEQLNNKEEFENMQINTLESIANKGTNVYGNIGIIDEDIVRDYIATYKKLALAYPEVLYNQYLDEEYKQKRFATVDNFKKYITENKEQIKSISIEQYACTEQLEYTQYIVIDQYGKYYIFNANKAQDYKILLDSYTIDLPQFIEKYDKSNSVEKVGYNIQKCIEAINNKDYNYVYNKLDDEFKQNNYPAEEKFIESVKENLFESNIIKTVSSLNEGNIYVFDITISDANDKNKEKSMSIIMQLKEGTDFVMSFSYKE